MRKQFKKTEINEQIVQTDLQEDQDKDNFSDVESDVEQSFTPNIKDEQKKQNEIIEDHIFDSKKGSLV